MLECPWQVGLDIKNGFCYVANVEHLNVLAFHNDG